MYKCFDGGNCGEGGYCDECPMRQQASSGSSDLLCADCGFEINPPLGVPFYDNEKVRCASCAVHDAMRVPAHLLGNRR
jgi:hypothetical protein